jgi:asparagine synthase (glutamine-hydrolysing)
MSIIFGVRRSAGESVSTEELLTLALATQRYAPDGIFVQGHGNIGMGFQPYHTHERSQLESQPASDGSDNFLVLDGRLDNYTQLKADLKIVRSDVPDSALVLAAFERWGEQCFSHFIGDWALALWSERDRVTYLARDHAGTRTLYFQNANGTLRWSTYLETFFAKGEKYSLDEQYAACFLCGLPTHDLTPYEGIRAVPPAHYLVIKGDKVTRTAHWDWIAKSQIRYKSDAEYEEHLFSAFKQAVDRRTGPGAPILAELSGGMDSTSIVCMSDHIRKAQGGDASKFLDTISYFDPKETNWNEEPYFSITEMMRGKKGIHLETTTTTRSFEAADASLGISPSLWPGMDRATLDQEQALCSATKTHDYRAILSGIGGDEVLGGVPTPLPELADLLVCANLPKLLKQTTAWCISTRMPALHMLYGTTRFVATLYTSSSMGSCSIPPWISHRGKTLDPTRQQDPHQRSKLFSRPSALCNGRGWWAIQGTLPHLYPSFLTRYEYRYPYLDRDLVDYLYRIPRTQLVRPGFRRSLMRRAFATLIPREILLRRRKAYISHGPLVALRAAQDQVEALIADSATAGRGLVDREVLLDSFRQILNGQQAGQLFPLINTVLFELWLRTTLSDAPHATLRSDTTNAAKQHRQNELLAEVV